jgi:hypothetical protein
MQYTEKILQNKIECAMIDDNKNKAMKETLFFRHRQEYGVTD